MESAVIIRDAYKSYGRSSHVLKGLDMDVPQGAIYGLLGPSGCGKTTLLSCIVGRVQLDAGVIQTTAKSRADVGYMPQDVALLKTMTVEETLLYYGRLYGMANALVCSRAKELTGLLELTSTEALIGNLSGGQQRRVSLAVTLLHNPQLLILDEPTVGLDPILSDSIWKYLLNLSVNNKKSIIITTHYIEEARQAHVIGLMRGGVLLAQSSPAHLMTSNGCETLEEVFLKFSARQELNVEIPPIDKCKDSYSKGKHKQPEPHFQNSELFSSTRFFAQLLKNFFSTWRSRPMLAFLVFMPVVLCTLFNTAIGGDPESASISLAVVDHELPQGLDTCALLPRSGCPLDLPLSCLFLDQIRRREFKLVEVDSLEDARHLVRTNKAWGAIQFGHNYSEALVHRLDYYFDDSFNVVNDSMVNIQLDMTNMIVSGFLRTSLMDSYVDFLKTVYRGCEWPDHSVSLPLRIEDPVYGSRNPSFRHFSSVAILVLFEFYLPMTFTIGVIMDEKTSGILERSMVAGLTALELVLAHSFIQFGLILLQTASMHVIIFNVFGTPYIGDYFSTTMLLVLQGLLGMTYGFFLSVVSDTMLAALFLGMGSLFPLTLIGGLLWPVEGMHPVLRSVSGLLPQGPTVEATRALTARGWGLHHPVVFKGFLSTTAWLVITVIATAMVVRLRKGIGSGK